MALFMKEARYFSLAMTVISILASHDNKKAERGIKGSRLKSLPICPSASEIAARSI
jgi:hypothetical protein